MYKFLIKINYTMTMFHMLSSIIILINPVMILNHYSNGSGGGPIDAIIFVGGNILTFRIS